MSLLSFRRDRLDKVLTGRFAPETSSTVVVYRAGAQVKGNQTVNGAALLVLAGHYFPSAGSVKLCVMRYSGGAWALVAGSLRSVSSSDATHVTPAGPSLTVLDGDYLVNLGTDSALTGATPAFDGSTAVIYPTGDSTGTAISQSRITPNTQGEYQYYSLEDKVWEVILSGTTPQELRLSPAPLNRGTTLPAAGSAPGDVFILEIFGAESVEYTWLANAAGTYGWRTEQKQVDRVRYAHLFATSGLGTTASPWVTAGSNPLQAAYNDLPAAGVGGKGTVRMIEGVYDLGAGSTGFVADGAGGHLFGFTLEGVNKGSRVSQDGGVNVAYVNDGGAVLLYSGTGAAIKIGEFSTAGTKVAEGCVLKNFKLRQSGTKGNGVGILMRLFRSGNVQDVNITDFGTGIATASVSDFNTFIRVQTNDCHAYGVDLARTTDESGGALLAPNGQCNANWFYGCGFSLTARDSTYPAYGVRVDGDAVRTVFRDCWFQNFDTNGYAAVFINSAISGAASNTTEIDGCYFEGNYSACYYNNPTLLTSAGLSFTNNYVTQIEGYGVWCNSGQANPLCATDGITIIGNTFHLPNNLAPYDVAKGVLLGTYIQNAQVLANSFLVGTVAGSFLGGNITSASGVCAQNNLVIGSQKITGALSLDLTLGVVGPSTLTGGVTGGIPRNVGTWQPPSATPGSYKQPVTTEMYVGSIFVPTNMTVIGIQYLIGTTLPSGQTVIAALYSQAGTKVAASVATAMTTTVSIKQRLPFTGSAYAAIGPGWYFIGLMFNTATAALVAMIPAVGDVGSGVVGTAVTGLTAMTPPASITPPTDFPGAALVPIASLY